MSIGLLLNDGCITLEGICLVEGTCELPTYNTDSCFTECCQVLYANVTIVPVGFTLTGNTFATVASAVESNFVVSSCPKSPPPDITSPGDGQWTWDLGYSSPTRSIYTTLPGYNCPPPDDDDDDGSLWSSGNSDMIVGGVRCCTAVNPGFVDTTSTFSCPTLIGTVDVGTNSTLTTTQPILTGNFVFDPGSGGWIDSANLDMLGFVVLAALPVVGGGYVENSILQLNFGEFGTPFSGCFGMTVTISGGDAHITWIMAGNSAPAGALALSQSFLPIIGGPFWIHVA